MQIPALSDQAIEFTAARCRLLGEASRLRILRALMQRDHSVQQLCEACNLTQPNASRHLSLLRREGIVDCTRDGRHAYYRIIDPDLCDLCEQVCGGLSSHPLREQGVLGAYGAGI